MLIYWIGITTTIILLIIDRMFDPSRKHALIGAIATTFPLVLISGLRTTNIGTDFGYYVLYNFQTAKQFGSFAQLQTYISTQNGTEFGYNFLNYVVTRVTDNLNVFLIVIAEITMIALFFGARVLEKYGNVPIEFQFFVYFCFLYGPSLNIVRQSIAIAFIYWATTIALFEPETKLKWVKFIFLVLIAFTLHRSSALTFVLPLLIFVFGEKKSSPGIDWARVVAVIGISIIVFFIANGQSMSQGMAKYSIYFDGGSSVMHANVMFTFIRAVVLSLLPAYALFELGLNKDRNDVQKAKHEHVLLVMNLILGISILVNFIAINSIIAERLQFYFFAWNTIIGSYVLFNSSERKYKLFLLVSFSVLFIIIFIVIVGRGEGEIFPYQSVLKLW